MDEDLLKRNTDCVYFLASPFTCKKGAECEYRHSEMARLNPRDCWYWLSGNCLNPTCGFRHPPMDTHAEASAEAEILSNNASLPPSKNSVPCYFYFSGYCGKGDKCTFLHGSEDISAVKLNIDSASAPLDTKLPSKAVPKITVEKSDAKVPSRASVPKITAEQLDAKVPSTKLDTKIHAKMRESKVCLITEPVPDLPEKGPRFEEVSLHQKMRIQSSSAYTIVEQKTFQHGLASEFEEAPVSKSASLNPPENIDRSDPSIYSDQSSEDQVDIDNVRDERWDSSPGFDVLVEGRTEGMTYGDDDEYMHGYDGNDEDHENLFLDHCCEDRNVSNYRFLLENRIHEASYYSDDDERYDLNDYTYGGIENNRIMPQKRKFLTIGLPIGGHHNGDLREHLSKRRFHAERDAFRHSNFPLHTEERRREPQRNSIQRFNGRLASKLERNGVNLTSEKSAFVVPDQRGHRARNQQLTTRHHHHERKKLQFPSRVQRKPFSRQKREIDNNISFAGPKTLAQIKEEKDRARDGVSLSSSEILQVKKRGGSAGEEEINISS